MTENGGGKERGLAQLSEAIIYLIFDRKYDQAASMIENSRHSLPDDEGHRLAALSAVLQNDAGNLSDSIDLIRQAQQERPTWLPHLYRLSVYLMDAERWLDANTALDELISLSENEDDKYFLDEARLRKIVCLTALGRKQEIQRQKDKISAGAAVFIGDRLYRLDDLD